MMPTRSGPSQHPSTERARSQFVLSALSPLQSSASAWSGDLQGEDEMPATRTDRLAPWSAPVPGCRDGRGRAARSSAASHIESKPGIRGGGPATNGRRFSAKPQPSQVNGSRGHFETVWTYHSSARAVRSSTARISPDWVKFTRASSSQAVRSVAAAASRLSDLARFVLNFRRSAPAPPQENHG